MKGHTHDRRISRCPHPHSLFLSHTYTHISSPHYCLSTPRAQHREISSNAMGNRHDKQRSRLRPRHRVSRTLLPPASTEQIPLTSLNVSQRPSTATSTRDYGPVHLCVGCGMACPDPNPIITNKDRLWRCGGQTCRAGMSANHGLRPASLMPNGQPYPAASPIAASRQTRQCLGQIRPTSRYGYCLSRQRNVGSVIGARLWQVASVLTSFANCTDERRRLVDLRAACSSHLLFPTDHPGRAIDITSLTSFLGLMWHPDL